MKDTERYNDIINLPHHQSKTHPHMPNGERAAQFSPFAALKGYDDEIEETARYTAERNEFDESALIILNEKLRILKEQEREHPQITASYFQADGRKSGGAYLTAEGRIRKIDEYNCKLIMESGETILFQNLIEIEL